MTFGEFVREKRLERGLTQRGLASALGVDFTYISKIETGSTMGLLPSARLLADMADVLGVHTDEMMNRAGKIDTRKLMELAIHDAAIAQILRSIQDGLTEEQRSRILAITQEDTK